MKLTCPMTEDLLPFYYDNTCSQESRQLIEDHLKDCRRCRGILSDLQEIIPYVGRTEKKGPLKSVGPAEKKEKNHKLRDGVLNAVFFGAMLLVGLWAVNEAVYITYPTEHYAISNVSQHKDYEEIFFTISAPHPDYISFLEGGIVSDGNFYVSPKHKLFDRIEEIPAGILEFRWPPYEMDYRVDCGRYAENEQEIQAIYFGSPRDAILVWQEGQELPGVSQEILERSPWLLD